MTMVRLDVATARSAFVLALLLVSALPDRYCAQAALDYQDRGNRHEGVRQLPVSGYDIELISALVDYSEPVATAPDLLRLRFFLQDQTAVHVTVRELDVKHFYWMDRVQPAQSWRRGFDNEFAWPTGVVLGRLEQNFAPYKLGIVARLHRPEPSADERVASVILYHSTPPTEVNGYVFAFKTNGAARVAYAFYPEQRDQPLASEVPLRVRGGRPFTVHWDASSAAPGPYRLVLRGYFLDSNQPLYQTVRFVHQPVVR